MYEFKVIATHLLARHWSFKLGNCKAKVDITSEDTDTLKAILCREASC